MRTKTKRPRTGDLTYEFLSSVLSYEEETGFLYWKVRRGGKANEGTRAGSIGYKGYELVNFYGLLVPSHRIAWMLYHGRWPTGCIDHINGIRSDNRLSNLRECSLAENSRNRGKSKSNSSGLKGAYYYKAQGRFCSKITFQRKMIFLGYFDTAELAHEAYVEASKIYHGEFAHD